jgi:hypothetical protein
VSRYRRRDLDVTQLTRVLADEQACRDLRLYFGVGPKTAEVPRYTGGRFEFLDGGGDRADVHGRFTASDIVALSLLGVQLPPRVSLDLLEGGLGQEASALLGEIPVSVNLWDAEAAELIEKGGPADRLWWLVEEQDGAGWVTAGKLLARKRPSLIPVYDNVVRCAFGWPEKFWTALHKALRDEDGSLQATLNDLKQRADLPCQVSPLRVLDVAIWMRHRRPHASHRCKGLA